MKIQVRIKGDYNNPGVIVGNIDRKIKSEMVGNFNPIYCTYHYKKYLVESTLGDLSDPFRRNGEYLKHLYITL